MQDINRTENEIDETERLRKKLIFRAGHRGTKEMDILLGGFAIVFLPQYDESKLFLFEELLNCPDPDIYNWITGQEPLNIPFLAPVIADIEMFYARRAP